MGGSFYDQDSRSTRTLVYKSAKSADDIFEQNRKRTIHESMEPSKALLREARDSENHPLSLPIIVALDVTGSMGRIPEHLVKDGLPNMMANIIEHGIADPQILFVAVGDTKCDHYPFQVGQFESGDEELDLWLTRTYIEGHGGGNGGESYFLPWYFAAKHTVTDAWEKRKEKGFLFTIGDEPCHDTFTSRELKDTMGINSERSYSAEELLKMAQEKYNVYHLHILEGDQGYNSHEYWKKLLGEHCISVTDHEKVGDKIAEIVTTFVKLKTTTTEPHTNTPIVNKPDKVDQQIIL